MALHAWRAARENGDDTKEAGSRGQRCQIPVGSLPSEKPSAAVSGPAQGVQPTNSQSLPMVMFRNSGSGSCMEKCFCSGLYHAKYHKTATELDVVFGSQQYIRQGDKRVQKRQFKKTTWEFLSSTKQFKRVSLRSRMRFDPFNSDHHRDLPILAELKATTTNRKGKRVPVGINHCVAFVGGWVFDSNQPTALPTSRESLDKICDNVLQGSEYSGIYWHLELFMQLAES